MFDDLSFAGFIIFAGVVITVVPVAIILVAAPFYSKKNTEKV
ncbi:MAG: hypothetical protein WC415_00705 [Patescibacteria group bacterium]